MNELLELLDQWETPGLACGSQTRVFTTILQAHNIPHTCMAGTIIHTATNERIPLHFWIELPDGATVDYCARLRLGRSHEIPHGVFRKEAYPQIVYAGLPIPLEPLSPPLLKALTNSPFWETPLK